jgi:hypothetical protein
MGQYQQWLHYQDIDRRLHATLQALEHELAQLDGVVLDEVAQQPDSLEANPIISALLAHMVASSNGHLAPQENIDNCDNAPLPQAAEQASNDTPDTISPALLHWSELPDFGSQEMNPPGTGNTSSFLATGYTEIALLPEDLFAFFDEHMQTDPQLELPWWLRKINITSRDDESGKPIDQESMRTNRLVRRWIERWGRQPPTTFPPESESESEGMQHES